MSVEAIYPSQQQPKADNPLFARGLRRRRLAFMAVLTMSGLGLLVAQIVPMTARAENPAPQPEAVVPVTQKVEPQAQASQAQAPQVQAPQAQKAKVIRQIPLYNLPAETSLQKDAKKS